MTKDDKSKDGKDNEGDDPNIVHATPTKRFFVDMLTRDIELSDAILDLLDNCIDGVVRSLRKQSKPLTGETPYEGFSASISISPDEVRIEDNCGGIDREIARKYAFTLGRLTDDKRDKNLPTVGLYGIGMKRAIFKMGRSAKVISRPAGDAFEVDIKPSWFAEDLEWDLPLKDVTRKKSDADGTTVVINQLLPSIKEAFAPSRKFSAEFAVRIQSHFSLIIQKGFSVTLNGKEITPRPIDLLFETPAKKKGKLIEPYRYEGKFDGVDVSLAVGFYRSTPSEGEVDKETDARHTSDEAGWTIVCNDRVVVFCDKTRLTGWGTATVPQYHPQFIAISGIVEFRSNTAEKLPLTTTKRGLDASSEVYLAVKDYMCQGLKTFTSYTNKWKATPSEARPERSAEPAPIREILKHKPNWSPIRGAQDQRRYIPDLPLPPTRTDVVIHFRRPEKQIRKVSAFLFGEPDVKPSTIGEKCFDSVLEQAKK